MKNKSEYTEVLKELTLPLSKEKLLCDDLLMYSDEIGKLKMYYTPFEHINKQAKVVIAGITPGLQQMQTSIEAFIENQSLYENEEKLYHSIKRTASFAGSMRKNLITMLDEIGLNNALHIPTTAMLFNEYSHLVHTTSVVKYPVMIDGKNYTGSSPSILKTPILKKYATEQFVSEINQLDNPYIIPLGKNVQEVIEYLIDEGVLKREQCLLGFPHPSGANGHRKKQFERNFEELKEQIHTYFS